MKFSVASCLLAALISSILVIAIPIPGLPGQVVQRKNGGATSSSTEHYQGVVLGAPNAHGDHQIAQVAARLDKATYPHQAKASDYHPEFKAGHVINTGKPITLHGSEIEASQKVTTPMTSDKLAKLKSNIIDNCNAERTGPEPGCTTMDSHLYKAKRPMPKAIFSKAPFYHAVRE